MSTRNKNVIFVEKDVKIAKGVFLCEGDSLVRTQQGWLLVEAEDTEVVDSEVAVEEEDGKDVKEKKAPTKGKKAKAKEEDEEIEEDDEVEEEEGDEEEVKEKKKQEESFYRPRERQYRF